ncbi:hypothetical protein ACP0HM_08945 [Escherichia coli]
MNTRIGIQSDRLLFLAYRVISHVLRSSCVATAYRLIILRLERNKAGKKTRITVLPLTLGENINAAVACYAPL